jgi:hypothetical protein
MTANSTEAVTDRAIPLDKLSSRVEGQTGRAGYVVFVLNIGRVINIYNILADPQPKHSQQTDTGSWHAREEAGTSNIPGD